MGITGLRGREISKCLLLSRWCKKVLEKEMFA